LIDEARRDELAQYLELSRVKMAWFNVMIMAIRCCFYLKVLWWGELGSKAGVSVGVSEIDADDVANLRSQFVDLLHGLQHINTSTEEWIHRF
jgi:hypothetical protein